jgi:hypothetical protein
MPVVGAVHSINTGHTLLRYQNGNSLSDSIKMMCGLL